MAMDAEMLWEYIHFAFEKWAGVPNTVKLELLESTVDGTGMRAVVVPVNCDSAEARRAIEGFWP